MSYVPGYLAYTDRQVDGWPNGISSDSKKWAVERVKNLFALHGRLDLDFVQTVLFEDSDRPEDFHNKALWDFRFATADRALRAVARQVWVLE